MKTKISIAILLFISYSTLHGMGTWIFNNRSHGELRWSTIKTENFDIHYHDDIREIAVVPEGEGTKLKSAEEHASSRTAYWERDVRGRPPEPPILACWG